MGMINNVFDMFYAKKLEAHTHAPPSSKRGGRARLDRKRYQASLLQLTSMKQREIANLLGVSHGTLRNWNANSGGELKTLLGRHRTEFAHMWIDKLAEKVQEHKIKMYGEFESPPSEFITKELPRFEWDFFGEPNDLSLRTVNEIASIAVDRFKDSVLMAMVFLKWAETIPAPIKKGEKILKEGYLSVQEILHVSLSEEIQDTLLKSNPSNEDKNISLYALEMLKALNKRPLFEVYTRKGSK